MKNQPTIVRRLPAAAAGIILAMTFLVSPPASAQNTNYNWCFSPAYDATRGFPEPNMTDGSIDDDIGWSNSFRQVFNNGTNDPDVTVIARAQGDHIDLGVQVKNDSALSTDDTIVIAFGWNSNGGGGAPNTFARLHISPVTAGGVDPVGTWQYWSGSGNNASVTWSGASNQVTWLTQHTTSGGVGSNLTWDTEIRIQIGANTPLHPLQDRPFSMYLNLFRAESGGLVTQFPWPAKLHSGVPGTDDDLLLLYSVENTPRPEIWGRGIVGATTNAGGINFARADITSDPAHIVANQPVVLTARLHNNSIDGATGAAKSASNVIAVFNKAPFGMSGFNNWSQIGQTVLPSVAYDGPGLGGSPGTAANVNWTPTTADLLGGTTGHNCIRVQLSSNAADTTFVNQGEFNNMWVHAASRFNATPVLRVNGLRTEPKQTKQRIHINEGSRFQYAYADGSLPEIPAGTLTAELDWRFIGGAETRRYCDVGRNRYYLLEPMASYGFAIQHALSPTAQRSFEEANAPQLDALYKEYRANQLKIAHALQPEKSARVRTGREESAATTQSVKSLESVLPAQRPTAEAIAKLEPAARSDLVRRLNTLLGSLKAKPSPKNWNLSVPKAFKRVSEKDGSQYVVEVAVEKEVKLPTVIEAKD